MTIKDDYFRYLDHFGSTITLRELHHQSGLANAIALRHDIDHDLDLALEVAHHEHARNIHATYFLLHTHPYWHDPQFHAKCEQLQAYGHEVGLHLNVMVQWMNRQCESVEHSLAEALTYLRQRGVIIEGVSAHGDKACYQHQIINYWIFRELRGSDPASSERLRSAEGVVVDDARWQVKYPDDHALHRDDGRVQALWSVSMADQGLEYDAMHVPIDRYWTDSGGAWSRSGDPLHADMRRGRHQVLMHPYWWRGPKKTIFVLSTARAGSTWLANFVDRATSCKGLHEWTLNHYRRGDEVIADKRTSDDYLGVIQNAAESALLIRHALATFKIDKRDVLEANVYLEPLLERLQKAAPDAVIIHLHRDARDVVRSILNRGWYAAPIDYRHRDETSPLWPVLNQFERACWYWRFTNERLWPLQLRLSFERMVSDLGYLTSVLNAHGIIVHPLLAAEEFSKRINAGADDRYPAYDAWSESMQVAFQAICGPMQELLGYESDEALANQYRPPRESGRQYGAAVNRVLNVLRETSRPFGIHQVKLKEADEGLMIQFSTDSVENGHVVFANGIWHAMPPSCGVSIKRQVYFTGAVEADLINEINARLFLLCFDSGGRQTQKTQLTGLRGALHKTCSLNEPSDAGNLKTPDQPSQTAAAARFSFVPADTASHFALALVLDRKGFSKSGAVIVRSMVMEARRIDSAYPSLGHRHPLRR